MSLTQHEIVDRLGISRGTLHRILIGSPLVKGSTRDRVLRELERLNYVPNAIARSLKTRRTHSLGLIGPAAIKVSNIEKLNSLHLAARERKYSVLFGFSDGSPEQDQTCIRDLRARMVDGLIVMGRGMKENVANYQKLVDDQVPVVTVFPIPGLSIDCVYVDTRLAFAQLTDHLIKLGHSKIGLLLDPSRSMFTINRELGFRDAMKAADLPIREDWIIYATPDGNQNASSHDATGEMWRVSDYQCGFWGASLVLAKRERPTALVCFSDEFAIGVLRAADLAGIRVPEELALVGYDDKESARFARVPLTTMHQPDEKIGKEAISLLIDRINGSLPDEPLVRPLEATLVVRDSCGSKSRERRAP